MGLYQRHAGKFVHKNDQLTYYLQFSGAVIFCDQRTAAGFYKSQMARDKGHSSCAEQTHADSKPKNSGPGVYLEHHGKGAVASASYATDKFIRNLFEARHRKVDCRQQLFAKDMSEVMPSVSIADKGMFDIIIVNYNSTDLALSCLASLNQSLNGLPVNIYVVDNASIDDVDRVVAEFPDVRLLKNSINLGFARGTNQILKRSSAPYAIILNPDTLFQERFFEPVMSFLEENLDVGILGPKIVNPDGSVQGSARAFPSLLTAFFGRNTFLTRLIPKNPISQKNVVTLQGNGTSPTKVDWVSGACMVIRRKSLELTGFFDERFFMYWEDADLCRRMWNNGWKVIYFPRATLLHHIGQSSRKRKLGSEWNFHISAYRLFSKYAEGKARFLKPIVALGLFGRFIILAGVHLCKSQFDQIK